MPLPSDTRLLLLELIALLERTVNLHRTLSLPSVHLDQADWNGFTILATDAIRRAQDALREIETPPTPVLRPAPFQGFPSWALTSRIRARRLAKATEPYRPFPPVPPPSSPGPSRSLH